MSAGLYGSADGVNRQIKKLYAPVGGVNREIKELWAVKDGVNRKIFQSRFGTAQGSTTWGESSYGWTSLMGVASADGRFQYGIGYDESKLYGTQYNTIPPVKLVFDSPFTLAIGDYLSILTKCTDNTNGFSLYQAYYQISTTGTVSLTASAPNFPDTVGALNTSTFTVSSAGTLSALNLSVYAFFIFTQTKGVLAGQLSLMVLC